MGDAEYKEAFDKLILPIFTQFNPDLILVSSGFDAAVGDSYFANYQVSPTMYAYMTHTLMSLAKGKVLLSLEGGYNPESNAESVCACVAAMLGDDVKLNLENTDVHADALSTIAATRDAHSTHWDLSHVNP